MASPSTSCSKVKSEDVSASKPSATFTWEIHNVDSKDFHASTGSRSAKCYYQLGLFPSCIGLTYFDSTNVVRTATKQNRATVFVYAWSTGCQEEPLYMHYRFYMLNNQGEKCNLQEGREYVALSLLYYEMKTIATFSISRDYLSAPNFVVDGKITFYCEIFELNEPMPDTVNTECLSCFSKNMKTLLESGQFADVILKIGDHKLKAHKAILSAQSPVFAAMFKNECKDKQESVLEIGDVSVEVLQKLLCFIYSGQTTAFEQYPPELMAAADKYQLNCLKSSCARYISANLEVDSVADTLLLADLHQETELKTKCIEYIHKRVDQVMATEGWMRLMATNRMDLLAELYKNSLQHMN